MTTPEQSDDAHLAAFEARQREQASQLKAHASRAGLRLEVYMLPKTAKWVLEEVEDGRLLMPADAVYVALQTLEELDQYPDLKEELLRRRLEAAMNDPRPPIPAEEAFARLKARMNEEREEPAVWQKSGQE